MKNKTIPPFTKILKHESSRLNPLAPEKEEIRSGRKKILLVATEIPYPAISGGRIRTANLFEYLRMKGNVTILATGHPYEDSKHLPKLKEKCEDVVLVDLQHISYYSKREPKSLFKRLLDLWNLMPWELADFQSDELQKAFLSLQPDRFDLIVFHDLPLGHFIFHHKEFNRLHQKTVFDIDNLSLRQEERNLAALRIGYEKVRKSFDLAIYRHYLKRLNATAGALVCSEIDQQYLIRDGVRNVFVIPNIIGTKELLPPPNFQNKILFCGMLSYPPNIEGVKYFVKEILPKIQSKIPNVQFTVIGRNLGKELQNLGVKRGVSLVGFVPDVKPYYEKCAISVVPLLDGAGTRIKILESMAYGRPVVSTSIGAEGLEVKDGKNILIADDPERFANHCVELLKNAAKWQQIAEDGYQFVQRKYGDRAFARSMDECFRFLNTAEPSTTVSVVLRTYNRSNLVKVAIESVLHQTFKDWELIVVNDGSTDKTVDVLKHYADQDTRIRYINQPNSGAPNAGNAGLREAKGKYVAFLDDDDRWVPDKLQIQAAYMEAYPEVGMLYSRFRIARTTGGTLDPSTEIPRELPTTLDEVLKGFIPTPTVMIRKSCLDQMKWFNPSYRSQHDFDLYSRFVQRWKIVGLESSLAETSKDDRDSLSKNNVVALERRIKITQNLELTYDYQRFRYLKKRHVARLEYLLGYEFYDLGDYWNASKHFIRAILNYPLVALLIRKPEDKGFKFLLRIAKTYAIGPWCFLKMFGKSRGPHIPKEKTAHGMPILIAESGSGYGGSGRYLSNLLSFVDRNEFLTEVVAYGKGPFIQQIEEKGIEVDYRSAWRFPWGEKGAREEGLGTWGYLKYLIFGGVQLAVLIPVIAFFLKRRKIKLVHLNCDIISHLPILFAAKITGARTLCHLHLWRHLTATEKWAARFVDRFVAVTHAGAEFYRHELKGINVLGIPNGLPEINGSHFSESESGQNLREELQIRKEATLAVLIGRLIPFKGHSIFLQALAKARREKVDVYGLIVGNDPSGDHSYRKQLEDEISSLGIQDCVSFLDWQKEMGPVYRASDIIMQPSSGPESFGYVALEGMSMGKPVIASRGGGLSEVVSQGETGLLVEPGDSDGFAQAIIRLSKDRHFASQLGANGRDRVQTVFNMEQNGKRIAEVYRELLNSPAEPKEDLSAKQALSLTFKRTMNYTGVLRLVRHSVASKVPILMYHRIREVQDPFFPSVMQNTFRAQIEFIKRYYHVLSMDEVVRYWEKGEMPSKGSIVITFDDGDLKTWSLISPVIKEFDIPVTIFIATDSVDKKNLLWTDTLRWSLKNSEVKSCSIGINGFNGVWSLRNMEERLHVLEVFSRNFKAMPNRERKEAMEQLKDSLGMKDLSLPKDWLFSWEQVKKIRREGVAFGAHTVSHPIIGRLTFEEAWYEISESKKRLEEVLSEKVNHFAYPNGELGDFNQEHEELVKKAGFDSACSTILGLNDAKTDRYALRRVYAREESLSVFASRLVGIGS